MFNFVNKTKRILTEADAPMDTRLHIFMVTIPGFGKTYTINQFGGKYNGILKDTKIETGKIGSLTSAGLVGSIKTTPDGQVVVNKGVLQRKPNHILMSDEFSNIISAASTSHSKNIIDDLLIALDSGEMNKDQSGGALEYDTYSTVWAATQPGRFDLKSGLNRRFAFVIYMPDIGDVYKYRKIREESKNLKIDVKRLLEYKISISARKFEIEEELEEVVYTDEYYKWVNSFFAMHYEDILYERILLGYWLMKVEKIPKKLVLTLNDEVKKIMLQQMDARMSVQKGVEKIKIMEILRHIQHIKLSELTKMLLSFAIEPGQIDKKLSQLVANNLIKIDKDTQIVTNKVYVGDRDA